jgi:hypothetical protein
MRAHTEQGVSGPRSTGVSVSTWADLKSLRDAGHRPAHMLTVFAPRAHRNFRAAMFEIGAMVIDHELGDPIPVELLGGLEVLLMFEYCGDTCEFARRLPGTKYPPARCRAWCSCSKALTIAPGPCSRRAA